MFSLVLLLGLFQLGVCVHVVCTALTPAPLLSVLTLPCLSYEEVLELEGVHMLLDVTFEQLKTERLAALCEERQIVLMVLGPAGPFKPGKWTFYLGGEAAAWVAATSSVLQWLHVESSNLISDVSSFSLQLKHAFLRNTPSVHWSSHLFSQHQSALYLVGNVIRPYGNRFSVFTASAEATKRVLKAQYQMHIGGTGYANVLIEESALFNLEKEDYEANLYEGNLIIAREITSNATNFSDFYSTLYEIIRPYLATGPEDLLSVLNADFPNHILECPYVLLNMQNGTRRVVGKVKDWAYEGTGLITYLGGALSPPSPSKALIPLSGNFGGEVVNGYRYTTDSQVIGAVIAIEEINSRSEMIPNFQLDCWNFTGGIGPISSAAYTTILSNPDRLGASILAGITSVNTMTMLAYLRARHVTVPVVGSAATSAALSSRSAFPNFIRTCIGDEFVNIATVQMIKRLGWKAIGLIAVDSPSNIKLQQDFVKLLADSNITVVTPPAYQVVASVSSLAQARANYTASFQHLIDTRCRIVLLLALDSFQYIPLVLYEMGIRKGDLVFISRDLHVELAADLTVEDNYHIAEVLYASLQLQPTSFTGSIGQSVLQAVYNRISGIYPSNYACYYYDSAYTIAYALSWMLQSGKDFFNSTSMMSALRGVRFVGCSGFVYFDTNSNNRDTMRFMIETTHYNESDGLFSEDIGVYDPGGVTLLAINSEFKWGDGSANIPSNLRYSVLGCPFEDRFVKDFKEGLNVFIGISMGLWTVTVAIAVAVCVKQRAEWEELKERKELEVVDVMVMGGAVVQLVQLVALGPRLAFLGNMLNSALDMSIGHITPSLLRGDYSFFHFWVTLESTIAAWFVLIAASCLCSSSMLGTLITDLSFAVANLLFVPFLSNLLLAFKCTQGTADIGSNVTFNSSFLDADCYFGCWSTRHFIIIGVTVGTTIAFVMISTWHRVKWQECTILLNVKCGVGFLTLKSPLMMLTIAFSQAFRSSFPVLHACLHLTILALYLLFCLKRATYMYRKVRIWHNISLLLCMWSTALAICSLLVISAPDLVFPLSTILGWLVILLIGSLYQILRVQSLLYRPKGIDTFYLFKFAFKPTTAELAKHLQAQFLKHSKMCVFKADIEGGKQPDTAGVEMITLKIQTGTEAVVLH